MNIIPIIIIALLVKHSESYNKLKLIKFNNNNNNNNNNVKRNNIYQHYSTESMFASLDKNNDGHLSISEIVSAVPDEVKKALVTLKLKNILSPTSESVKTLSNIIISF
jgi:hypothetical protein